MYPLYCFRKGGLQKARYTFNHGQAFDTVYFPVALIQQIEGIGKITVLLTKEAKAQHWEGLKKELTLLGKGHLEIEDVEIPIGKNEQELWIFFERVCGSIGDQVVVDITHGLRHFQILTILCLSYLHFVTSLNILGVYYAAYDVGVDLILNTCVSGDKKIRITPVFELSPFLSLLTWMDGVNAFNRYGDARVLSGTLDAIHTERTKNNNINTKMQELGSRLEQLSEALMVSRSDEVIDRLNELSEFMIRTKGEIQSDLAKWAKPFSLIADKVIGDYLQMIRAEDKLKQRLLLVEWYLNRNHIPQAITLLRETMVSKRIFAEYGNLDYEKDFWVRNNAEAWLNQGKLSGTKIGREWEALTKLRNDIAHCGFRSRPFNAKNIIVKSQDCFKRILKIWEDERLWK